MQRFDIGGDVPPAVQYLRQWHLDRRVPVALIFAIVMQSAAIIWWGASLSERVSSLEKRADHSAPQADRLTRVEVKVDSITDSLNEIKILLRRPLISPSNP